MKRYIKVKYTGSKVNVTVTYVDGQLSASWTVGTTYSGDIQNAAMQADKAALAAMDQLHQAEDAIEIRCSERALGRAS